MDRSDDNESTRVLDSGNDSAGMSGGDITRSVTPASVTVKQSIELPQGSSFGRYVVVRTLGSGGMGVVYLAYDPELDRGVALKVLRPGAAQADRQRSRDRLLREAQVMARLSHPNVVPVYDVGQVDGHVFVAMEFVEGNTLGRWIRREQPDWSNVITVFRAAGEGLAAAHARGLVHRDFKPENVMLDATQRPRVMDFGLARAAEDEADSDTQSQRRLLEAPTRNDGQDSRSGLVDSISSSSSLTRTGIVLGTPAYMAPEQHLGEALDPSSDQFSFCVALYEALYGERPFDGATPAELCTAALAGEVRPAPAGTRVPGWVRKVVIQGLAAQPGERFASMDDLIAALAPRRTMADRMRSAAPAVAVLALTLGGTTWWLGQQQAPCSTSDTALAESWGTPQAEAIDASFAATELSYAAQASERTTAAIDSWAQRWTEQHRDTCEATLVRHEQSDAALDLRMQCLRRHRGALDGLVAVLSDAETGTVERSLAATERLPSPEHCSNLEALQREVPLPDDPEKRAAIEALYSQVNQIESLTVAARFEPARAALDALRPDIERVGYGPLEVDYAAADGLLRESEGELDEAIVVLCDAAWNAEALGMDRKTASIATTLIRLVGVERSKHELAEQWSRLATAKLARLDDAPKLQAALWSMQGSLADARGDYGTAAEHFKSALALWEAQGEDSVDYAHALGNYGKVHYRAGRLDEAAETFERAATTLAEVLGPDHPNVGKTWSNAAAARHALGQYERARDGFKTAITVLKRAYGAEHLSLAKTHANLGNVHFRLGEYEQAIAEGERAVAIQEAALGDEHPNIGFALNNIAMAHSGLGDHEQALISYRKSAEQLQPFGPDHLAQIEPLVGEGEELMQLGRHAEAVAPLERAYALQTTDTQQPTRVALPAFALARALWNSDTDRPRARELAKHAQTLLVDSQSAHDTTLAAGIERWLAEHGSADNQP